MLPLTPEKIRHVAAMFKKGGSRGWKNYTSCMKDKHTELVGSWLLPLGRAVWKSSKSVQQGIGPARQSGTVDLYHIHLIDIPWIPDRTQFPVGLKEMVICGCFFVTREIEISLALAKHVRIDTYNVTIVLSPE